MKTTIRTAFVFGAAMFLGGCALDGTNPGVDYSEYTPGFTGYSVSYGAYAPYYNGYGPAFWSPRYYYYTGYNNQIYAKPKHYNAPRKLYRHYRYVY